MFITNRKKYHKKMEKLLILMVIFSLYFTYYPTISYPSFSNSIKNILFCFNRDLSLRIKYQINIIFLFLEIIAIVYYIEQILSLFQIQLEKEVSFLLYRTYKVKVFVWRELCVVFVNLDCYLMEELFLDAFARLDALTVRFRRFSTFTAISIGRIWIF